jgi:phosphotransferase system  glucose/maltose/N-acetylglucosamine-specific IIC component
MELEEMQTLWADLSQKIEKQDKIQKELLMEITKQRFRKKLNHIRVIETIGSIICFVYAMYFMSKLPELELWYNQIFAMITILIMTLLPIASLSAIKGMRSVKIDGEAPAKMLEKFEKSKIRFWKVQRYGMIFGALILVTILPPISEIQGSTEMISKPLFWMIYLPGATLFMYLFSRWALGKYKKVIDSSEKLLSEL